MPESAKRKLSAKQILADIRSGRDASELKHRHGLSDNSFGYVLRQLSTAGLLTEYEIRRLQPLRGSSKPPHEMPGQPQWRCPACNAPQATEASECPVCGVVVAKFVERQEQRDHAESVAPRFTRDPDPGGGKGWMPVILSIVVFALIGGAVLVWSSHRAKEKTNLAALDLRTPSSQEVESEAGQSQEDSNDLESTDIDSSEVKIEDGPGRIEAPPPIVALPKEVPARQAEPSREAPLPPSETPKYVTGVLRQFASGDFKKEVVEASKTYPVLFQFYSNT
ncbi:MAG: hypothetical protein ACLP5H_05130 [Desulfomonilaceae bacterium]